MQPRTKSRSSLRSAMAQANMKKRKRWPLCASIKLNVGGRTFETRAETLSACHYFRLVFGGRMPHGSDVNGRFFIDRSPELFAVLLQFLRTRQRPPESVFTNKWALLGECDFFGCDSFAAVLRGEISPFDLRPEDRALRQREHAERLQRRRGTGLGKGCCARSSEAGLGS